MSSTPAHGRAGLGLLGALTGLVLIVTLALAALAAWWIKQPLILRTAEVEVSVETGQSPRAIAQAWVDGGVDVSPRLLYEWFRWSGQARQIRAGNYVLETGKSAQDLLRMMVRGDERMSVVRLIDGWTFRQFRQELAKAPGLQAHLTELSDEQVMAELGSPGLLPEGQFFPDTYSYTKGSTDLAVLRRAHRAMEKQLQEAWEQRAADSPLKSPQELLILASIVEKETGRQADRGLVAGVFNNRLRIRMPLQTDPTVIYGLGEAFDGNLRRHHLRTDHPFNTYTRGGLPPTPIAMPGKAALMAAARPTPTAALYFVARGDGSSQFSQTLAEHNRAVNQYQRGLRKTP